MKSAAARRAAGLPALLPLLVVGVVAPALGQPTPHPTSPESPERLARPEARRPPLPDPLPTAAARDTGDDGARAGVPDRRAPFPPPLASPREPRTRLAPVRVDRPDRQRWVGLVNLGDAFPFRLLAPDTRAEDEPLADAHPPALWGEVAGGVFSRFDLEGHGNEFVEVHYRVGLRLRARWRGVAGRLAFYHVSSHLGDEFLERTGREPISTSREGVELALAAHPLPGVRVYGGPGALVRSTSGLEPGTLRAGAEWRPGEHRWGPFRPYASAELFSWQELEWEPTASAEAGLAFGGRYRLALIAGAGPSRAEQFFREDETLWGLSLSADF